MTKHAYLIMAHSNFDFLNKELQLLDDERNDIYIHIDKKAGEIDKKAILQGIEKSKVTFILRKKINWAGYSGIQCELELLKEATKVEKYAYYHLLSGADLPIKNKKDILKFFDEHQGQEFISFDQPVPRESDINRAKRYYFFQEIYGRNRKNPIMILLFGIDKFSVKLQNMLNVNRFRKENSIKLQKGPNWFSITHEFASYVLKKEKWIKRTFSYSRSGDEVFLQTLVNNSQYKEKLYQNGFTQKTNACLRKIDWGRGKPYTWRVEDYHELMESECLFARKFDLKIDKEIVDKIMCTLWEDSNA